MKKEGRPVKKAAEGTKICKKSLEYEVRGWGGLENFSCREAQEKRIKTKTPLNLQTAWNNLEESVWSFVLSHYNTKEVRGSRAEQELLTRKNGKKRL